MKILHVGYSDTLGGANKIDAKKVSIEKIINGGKILKNLFL